MASLSQRSLRVSSGVGAFAVLAALTLSGTGTAEAATGPTCLAGTCTVVFDLTGAPETFVVPRGVSAVVVTVAAGSGGSEVRTAPSPEYPSRVAATGGAGGTGGAVTGSVPVTGGQTITAVVGEAGADGVPDGTSGAAGGYGGGGAGGAVTTGEPHNSGGAGGGGSFLFVDDVLQIAAGGGGGGTSVEGGETIGGGAGGSTGAGADGATSTTARPDHSASGATRTAPGATATPFGYPAVYPGSPASTTPTTTPLALATAGAGAVNTLDGGYGTAGGGGGGYFGGGGGASDGPGGWVGAGGGGSAYQAPAVTGVAALAPHTGDGSIVLSYADPVAATTTTLIVSGTPSASSPVTLTATVSPASSTGTVVFTAGGTTLGSAPVVDGVATLTVALAAGDYSVVASYSGDTTSSDSVSPPLAFTVASAPTVPPTTPTDPTAPTPGVPAAADPPAVLPAAGSAAVTPARPTATRPGNLAHTGQDPMPGVLAAAALVLSGLGLQAAVVRRRRPTQVG